MVVDCDSALVVELGLPIVHLAIRAGGGNIGAEIAVAHIVGLRHDRFAGGELDGHFAALALVDRGVAVECGYSLEFAIMNIFAIMNADPKRDDMELDLAAGQLQHLEAVRRFRIAQAVISGDIDGPDSANRTLRRCNNEGKQDEE